MTSFSCNPARFDNAESMISCGTAGRVALLGSAKFTTTAAADDDDGVDGDRGPLGRRFITVRSFVSRGDEVAELGCV